MVEFHLPLLGFAAFSGTGKTTLLSKLIPLLKQKGYRIGIIKHTHHNIDIDKPGKDSFVLRESGANQIVVASRNRTAIIIEKPDAEKEPELADALTKLQTDSLDLVLVEGFKHEAIAKIELHRSALNKPYLYPEDSNIIAIAVENLAAKAFPIQTLDINKIQQIADFIENEFIKNHPNSNINNHDK
jgi:molybdopterin-guanine dinucleotide biosynthesis protein MobB